MKLEFEIADISRDEVINAMARRLLTRWSDDDGESDTPLAAQLASAVSYRITKIADEIVRQHFDDTVRERITAAVDAVIAEGWYESDGYGERIDLKARINAALTAPRGDSYHRQPSILQERLDHAAKSMLDDEFKKVVEDAKTNLREQLDGAVMAKVAASIKEALGLR